MIWPHRQDRGHRPQALLKALVGGHATLASAFVLFNERGYKRADIHFHTRQHGILEVSRGEAGKIILNFPICPLVAAVEPETLAGILGARPVQVMRVKPKGDYLVFLDSAETVRNLKPNLAAFVSLGVDGIAVTAPAEAEAEGDIVCRYFIPGIGIPEDPVTGALHTFLVPHWAKRLGKSTVISRQVSARGGLLQCRDLSERVEIAGYGLLTLRGEMIL